MKHNKARLGSNNPKIIVAFYIISLSLAKGRSANYPITLNPISLVIQVIQAINCDCTIAALSASVFYCWIIDVIDSKTIVKRGQF